MPVGHSEEFAGFFQTATGCEPYNYQRRLAGDPAVPDAILDGPKSLAINACGWKATAQQRVKLQKGEPTNDCYFDTQRTEGRGSERRGDSRARHVTACRRRW
jgi:hypothetical protein